MNSRVTPQGQAMGKNAARKQGGHRDDTVTGGGAGGHAIGSHCKVLRTPYLR